MTQHSVCLTYFGVKKASKPDTREKENENFFSDFNRQTQLAQKNSVKKTYIFLRFWNQNEKFDCWKHQKKHESRIYMFVSHIW
mgnify:CR=1 FL=1